MADSARWQDTAIGELGYAAADDLAPAIEKWVSVHLLYGVEPEDLTHIAKEVVRKVIAERRERKK
jgi:hypothetical protein